MSYSDVQMLIASQIAYIDFDRDAGDDGQYTVLELLTAAKEKAEGDKLDKIEKLLNRIDENDITKQCGEWKIKDIRDNQSTSGMYACLLDTGDGDALVAFRGSESDSWDNIKKDWIGSDIGLANNVLTPQQKTAEKYLKDIYDMYGDEYRDFGLTGHSLGGNLAAHAAITAPDYMRDRISQCVNLDGPGFSNKYLLEHADEIEKTKGVINHYQWSWCGRLLNPVPGSNYQTIEAETPLDLPQIIINSMISPASNIFEVAGSMLWRHDTNNVVNFDKNGNVIPGQPDWLASSLDPIVKTIDAALFLITKGFTILLNNAIEEIKEGLENMRALWDRLLSSSAGQAQFEMNVTAVGREIGELDSIIPQMKEIYTKVEQIQKELAFSSVAAGYVKLKLWDLANDIERDVQKLGIYCKKGNECTQYYRSYEQKIVDNYG